MKKRGKKILQKSKLSQVWIETVVYTLIGLGIIGSILAVITPRLMDMSDRIVITQTIDLMSRLNEQAWNTLSATGGSQIEFSLPIKKGECFIDSTNDYIYYYLRDTGYRYSQPNVLINQSADITLLTAEKSNKRYNFSITLDYSAYNLTYNNQEINKTFMSAPTAYDILIRNMGTSAPDEKLQLDIKSIGG